MYTQNWDIATKWPCLLFLNWMLIFNWHMNGKYILIATLPDLDVSEVNLCLQMHSVELFKKKPKIFPLFVWFSRGFTSRTSDTATSHVHLESRITEWFQKMFRWDQPWTHWDIISIVQNLRNYLVGGLEHLDYVSIYWGCHHPSWRTHIFQRASNKPPTSESQGHSSSVRVRRFAIQALFAKSLPEQLGPISELMEKPKRTRSSWGFDPQIMVNIWLIYTYIYI